MLGGWIKERPGRDRGSNEVRRGKKTHKRRKASGREGEREREVDEERCGEKGGKRTVVVISETGAEKREESREV